MSYKKQTGRKMASIPITPILPRRRAQLASALDRARSRSVDRLGSHSDPCSPDPLGNTGQTPGIVSFLMNSGQRLITRAQSSKSQYNSTECLESPMDSPVTKSPHCFLTRSTSDVEKPPKSAVHRMPQTLPSIPSQAELKPVPSQPATGVGPRKG
ncbi:hypothetical protein RvY_13531 [Ramazzottius varieornatus]|uniref:Uncharacterized protein n=1 Tax=Ramazzottius varieornatus TaxID=947166 RepID=A0A1D1VWQ5_RAMVA|nr:hypothetical protein RvY_13531 [Ramazzottius varieornatus]